MALYHTSVYIPEWLPIPNCRVAPVYTIHAKKKIKALKIVPPIVVDLNRNSIIEAETRNKKMIKGTFRYYYSDKHDLCMVISFPDMEVVTLWLNKCNDNHPTLDISRYGKE